MSEFDLYGEINTEEYQVENEEDGDDDEENDEGKEEEEFIKIIKHQVKVIHALVSVCNMHKESAQGNRIERPLTRKPISTNGYIYIQQELNGEPESFRQLYRMYPNVFKKLCAIIRGNTLLQDTRFVCVEEMLATFLLTVGQNTRYCVTRKTFSRSHWTTSRNFNRMLKALNTIAPTMMVKAGVSVPKKIRESTRFYPYFKDCVGAIDGTHIPAMVSGGDTGSYRNRHGTISQNVLAACNFDLEFIYVLSGWEGSAHDSKLLNDALSRRNGVQIPQDKFFLVDCGFANRRQFLAPYRGVRYHLQDFTGEGRHPEKKEELFNLRHASLRNVVERIFGIFKSRFSIFKSAPPFLFKTQAEIVLACVGLHNFLRKECRSDEFPIEPDDEEVLSESAEEENYDEQILQSQEQQRELANEWRNNISSTMWSDAINNDNHE